MTEVHKSNESIDFDLIALKSDLIRMRAEMQDSLELWETNMQAIAKQMKTLSEERDIILKQNIKDIKKTEETILSKFFTLNRRLKKVEAILQAYHKIIKEIKEQNQKLKEEWGLYKRYFTGGLATE